MILCMLFIYKGFIQIYVFEYSVKNSETVSRDVLRKKVFLEISQNSQGKPMSESLF